MVRGMTQAQSAAFDARPGESLNDEELGSVASARGAEPARAPRLSVYTDLVAVEPVWRAFQERADSTVFQSHQWLSTWQKHVGALNGAQPVVVVGRDARDAVLFLVPLMIETAGGLRRLTWLGSDLCDYNAPLLAPEFSREPCAANFAALWREIVARVQGHPGLRFDLVSLTKMPERVGEQPNPFMQLSTVKNPSGAYLTRLEGDWASFYKAKRSSTTHRRDRTKRKKLSEIGAIGFRSPIDAGEIARSLDALMEQKGKAFAHMGVPNIFERPGWAEFYRALATDPAACDIAHVSRLDVGDAWAAINLGLLYRGCYYHVLASYDGSGEVAKYGPGAAHLQELMAYAIGRGCGTFDFTIGDEPYKRDWSDTELTLYDHVSAATWRGALAVMPMLIAGRIKRRIKRTPALWNAVTRARELVAKLRGR
jgi:CelD/BcsL family acetyltransferase involved in cellulose biosynthesis